MIVYHGATSEDIYSEIRSGTFVSEEDDYIAKSYADNMGEGIVYKLEIEPTSPFRIDGKNVVQVLEDAEYPEEVLAYARRFLTGYGLGNCIDNQTEKLVLWAKRNNYDYLKFKDPDFTNQVYGECGLIINPKIVKGFHSSEGQNIMEMLLSPFQ